MANLGDISKINLPNGNVVNIKDATARTQANWNTNNGVKNLLPINNASGTTLIKIPIVLPSGTFTLSIDNLTSAATGEGSRCCFMNGENAVSNVEYLQHTSNISATFTITATSDSLWIYAAGAWSSSNGKSLSITNAMLAPKFLYDADSTYEPYSLPNTKITPELIELVDSGAKNLLDISGQSSSGIYTVNSDGTVTANGATSSANWFYTLYNNITSFPFDVVLSGCPSGGSWGSNGYSIWVSDRSDNTIGYDAGSGFVLPANTEFKYIRIRVPYPTTVNLTYKPMLCSKAAWDVSQKFVPYRPSYEETVEQVAENKNNILKITPVTLSKRHKPQTADYEIISDLTISIPAGKKYLIHAMAMFNNVAPKGVVINKGDTISANKNTVYSEITNDVRDFGGLTTSAIMTNTGSTAFDACIFAKFKSASTSGSDVIVTYQDIT